MATEAEMQQVTTAAKEWTPNDVGKWLQSIGLQQYAGVFMENAIDGAALMYLDKEDMRDGLGIRKVGHRIKLTRELERFQQVHRVAKKNMTLCRFNQHYYFPCLHPFKARFRVTQASIEWNIGGVFGSSHHQIDMSSIRDLEFKKFCCRSYLTIHSSDATDPELTIPLARGSGDGIYRTIKRTWEHDQTKMARGNQVAGRGGQI